MKKFLLKIFLLVVISLVVLTTKLIVFKSNKICFLSNSLCYNAKAKFIQNNQTKLQHTHTFIIGSSMALYNISGALLEDSLKQPILNLSSWGMKLIDFTDFACLYNGKNTIIINIGFIDIGPTIIKKYAGYPLNENYELINMLSNYNTYLNNVSDGHDDSFKPHGDLYFDSTGSVACEKPPFRNDKLWNRIPKTPTIAAIDSLVHDLANYSTIPKVLIFFTPDRKIWKDGNRKKMVVQLNEKIASKYPNMKFYNNYELDLNDSLFIDDCHLNNIGQKIYTEVVLKEIRESKDNF